MKIGLMVEVRKCLKGTCDEPNFQISYQRNPSSLDDNCPILKNSVPRDTSETIEGARAAVLVDVLNKL